MQTFIIKKESMSVNEESVRDSSIEKVHLNTTVELSGDEK